VRKGSITDLICNDYRRQFFTKILPRESQYADEKQDVNSKAITNKDLFLSLMFFNEKQIKNRHFIRGGKI
jgi:hypothetical protein